ncbi:hypothetical protein LZ554_005669 [Drepanopeziza brunnea f. sp. 'monogermtubi']|nr:hypothetical protein LZ554_005669 [Drepanopeziza brunnea f. sp. 'monogermtubi']
MAASSFTSTRFASTRDEPKGGEERDTDFGDKMPRFGGSSNMQKPDDDGKDTDYALTCWVPYQILHPLLTIYRVSIIYLSYRPWCLIVALIDALGRKGMRSAEQKVFGVALQLPASQPTTTSTTTPALCIIAFARDHERQLACFDPF